MIIDDIFEINSKPFQSPGYFIKAAAASWEAKAALDLRHRVFVDEQKIFKANDLDHIDLMATHLVAISTMAHEADCVVGTVRIHEEEPGVWWGSRLAVDVSYRNVGRLGGELINLAVRTANARGCNRFLANVQIQNVILFRRMHWHPIKEIDCHGVPHMHMYADLDYYQPQENPEIGWYHKPRRWVA